MKKLLMVAFHFPPLAGSSGIQRTLRFVQHLPGLGWQPLVLSAKAMAYEQVSQDLMAQVPTGTVVRRALALDAQRHLALGGRYWAASARPDRWANWRHDAVRVGMQMVREHRPDAIWSTYPLATAHVIGAELQRRTGLPWIADFRDPMAQHGYPEDPVTWQQFKAIEAHAIDRARLSLFTTPSAARSYRERYPSRAERIQVLENGYDEESFAQAAPAKGAASGNANASPQVWLHSGMVYPSERDPTQLMVALRKLHEAGRIRPGQVLLRFRATAHDELVRALALEQGVADYVEVSPAIGYGQALREMMEVDALLLLQAANCNEQIPAKAYEYLRAGRPVLCLSDPQGDTARMLADAGIARIARLNNADEIAALLAQHLDQPGQGLLPTAAAVASASRLGRSRQLAQWLGQCVG